MKLAEKLAPGRQDKKERASPVRGDIRALSPYPIPESEGMVKLDAMENPHSLPGETRRQIGDALANAPINRYPAAGGERLKALIREAHAIGPENGVILGNGSDELIQMLITACCGGGGTDCLVMGLTPSFVMYEQLALIASAGWRAIALDKEFRIDMKKTLAEIERHKPRLFFIASPNNPTGNAFDAEDVERLAQAMAKCGWIVLDEAYAPYSNPALHAEYRKRLSGMPNALFMRTFSKVGLAGIRLGYLTGHEQELLELEKVRLPYNVNVYTQTVAIELLEAPHLLQRLVGPVIEERNALAARLETIPAMKVYPSLGNFLLVEVEEAEKVWLALRRRGILVKHLKPTPSGHLESHLRITVGSQKENRLLAEMLSEELGKCAEQ